MKIGIIGQGFVGTAIREGLRDYHELFTYDISKVEDFATPSLDNLVYSAQIIFQCLPTPMKKSGECDIRLVEETVLEVDRLAGEFGMTDKIVVIKSTVPPGTTEGLNKRVSNIQVVFSPEFLTEANSLDDFKNQARIILGGPRPATGLIKTMFRKVFPSIPIIKTGSNTAEMVKYFTNCFLATKVSFANEIKQICDKSNIDFDKVVEYSLYDKRIGKTHLSVPGPDGSLGYSGSCVKGGTMISTHSGNVRFDKLYSNFIEGKCADTIVKSATFDCTFIDEKRIRAVVKNKYTGNLIKLSFGGKTFECTENHLIPVLRDGVQLLIEAKYITKNDELYVVT